eukprot:CAMPEP_0119088992 /NCGR_PEP_ID=MMETSP1178-20130426/147437_1 /TAXON_ID=33656 /ORGANISM="unid sp, Strain CCMP2000" /LENGTH=281 /DNA_ID=CAMNT_0007072309 /DNA_START=9 /DNA_END=854 /DNA_ORIENTATION=-
MSNAQAERYKAQGNQALAGGMTEEAVRLYTLAIREDPYSEVYFSNRSAAYATLARFKEALDDADEVVRLKPAWVKGHTRRGAALSGLKKHEEARKAYLKALEVEPSNAQAREMMEAEAEQAKKAAAQAKDWENDLWSDEEGEAPAPAPSAAGGAGAKRSAPDSAALEGGRKKRAPGKLMVKLSQSLADASRDTLRVCLQQLCGADEHLAERALQMLEGLNENSSNGEDNDDDGSDTDGGGGGGDGGRGRGGGGTGASWPKPPALGSGGGRRMASGDEEDSD